MEWWTFVPAAIGAILGCWLFRLTRGTGWIVVVEFVGILNGLEEGLYKFTLSPDGQLQGGILYARRFWTEHRAKVAAAHLTLYGIAQTKSWRVKDVYVIRYRDFKMKGEWSYGNQGGREA